MNLAQAEQLLRLVAATVQRRDPLPPALRDSGLPGAVLVADALDRGAPPDVALAAALPADLRSLLAGPVPDLERAVLLAADDLHLQQETRAQALDVLARPLLTLLLLISGLAWIGHTGLFPVTWSWLWALPAALAVALLPLPGLLSPTLGQRLPWLWGWRFHRDRAQRFARAALAAQWRLPEEKIAPWFGGDLSDLAPILAMSGADRHCDRMSAHHRAAAARAATRLGALAVLGLHLLGAVLLIAAISGLANRFYLDVGGSFLREEGLIQQPGSLEP